MILDDSFLVTNHIKSSTKDDAKRKKETSNYFCVDTKNIYENDACAFF
jgi:hypothetical protein